MLFYPFYTGLNSELQAVLGLTQFVCKYCQNTQRRLIDLGSAIVNICSGIKCYGFLKMIKVIRLTYGNHTKVLVGVDQIILI